MFKNLYFIILVAVFANANEYKEFKEMCDDVQVTSGVTVSNSNSVEESIIKVKMKAQQDLAEEFIGVLVESEFIINEEESRDGYKEKLQSYLKTSTSGWIFPKYLYIYENGTRYYTYNEKRDWLTINAKLRCNKRVFRELKNKIDLAEIK